MHVSSPDYNQKNLGLDSSACMTDDAKYFDKQIKLDFTFSKTFFLKLSCMDANFGTSDC